MVLKEKVYINEQRVSLEIQAVNNSSLISKGLNRNYVKLERNEEISIICRKENGVKAGRLNAFVNTNTAVSYRCLKFEPLHEFDFIYCLQQEFRYTLEEHGYSFYDVICRLVDESHLASNTGVILHRLCN